MRRKYWEQLEKFRNSKVYKEIGNDEKSMENYRSKILDEVRILLKQNKRVFVSITGSMWVYIDTSDRVFIKKKKNFKTHINDYNGNLEKHVETKKELDFVVKTLKDRIAKGNIDKD